MTARRLLALIPSAEYERPGLTHRAVADRLYPTPRRSVDLIAPLNDPRPRAVQGSDGDAVRTRVRDVESTG
jgi:hypothetical protein